MLSADVVTFLEGGQSIHVATRNEANEPSGSRAVAATVEDDREHLTVFILQDTAKSTLANLRANGQLAVCFGRPVDDQACQVKGTLVAVREATPDERVVVEAQRDRLFTQLEQIGVPRLLVGGWRSWPCLAVRLRVTALFNQTPGPGAGSPLS